MNINITPSPYQRQVLLAVILGLAALHWYSYFQGYPFTSMLVRSREGAGPFQALGSIQFMINLLFILALKHTFEIRGIAEKVVLYPLIAIVLALIPLYSFSDGILSMSFLEIWEPAFLSFLFLCSIAFHIKHPQQLLSDS